MSDAGHRPENLTGEDLSAYPDPVALRGGWGLRSSSKPHGCVVGDLDSVSCFVFVVLAGGLGFLSFLGVVLACPSCFLGLLGASVFLVRSAPACLGWGAGCGGFWGSGFGAPGCLASFLLGGGSVACFLFVGGGLGGAPACARFLSCPVLAVVGSGGRVRGARVARFPWWGSGCARFPVRVRGVVVVFAGGFRVLFFPSGASRVLLVSGVGLRGLAGGWGVVGGVGLGWGCFFSGFCCTGPGLFGFGLGFVWRV